jgi:hypothetical protein
MLICASLSLACHLQQRQLQWHGVTLQQAALTTVPFRTACLRVVRLPASSCGLLEGWSHI